MINFIDGKREEEEEQENNFKEEVSDDYLENAENASESQERSAGNLKYTEIYHDLSKKLFDLEKTNNLICFKKADGQNKEYQPSISSPIVSQIEEVSSLPPQLQEQEQQHKRFKCFYCSHSYSSDRERIKHIDYQHPGKLYYPTLEDFEKRLL